MKILNFIFICFFSSMCGVVALQAAPLRAAAAARQTDEVNSLLVQVDKAISNKKQYDRKKDSTIEIQKQLLLDNSLSNAQRYNIQRKIVEMYRTYIIDSAILYTQRNIALTKTETTDAQTEATQATTKTETTDAQTESNLTLALLYSYKEMFIEAQQILSTVHKEKMSKHLLPLYYNVYRLFYGHYAVSTGNEIHFALNAMYRDSLQNILPQGSTLYNIIYAERLIFQKGLAAWAEQTAPYGIEEVEERLLETLKTVSPNNNEYAMVTFLLGTYYSITRQPNLQQKYLVLSALSDIRSSTKDNVSLQTLAMTLYETGDIDRAYRFMESAIDDMTFCNLRFKTSDLVTMAYAINLSYMNKELEQKRILNRNFWFIIALSFLLVVTTTIVSLQLYRLSRIRKKLSETNRTKEEYNQELQQLNTSLSEANRVREEYNQELQQLNASLSEANRVKEEYIAQFFHFCSSFIEKEDAYRKALLKKALANNHEEVLKTLKTSTIADAEWGKLYETFDNIFLDLYPNFVEQFNNLLIEDERIILKHDRALNTKLRVFALMRLGISDGAKIANFLRCSVSSVYNCRTSVRNAAISHDDFDDQVLKIGT